MKMSEYMDNSKTTLHLSQSNLQDFSDCPRRFQLKVIDNITWPAAFAEPISQFEKATEIGNKFHQLSHQFFSGIYLDTLQSTISDPDLLTMWKNFSSFATDLESTTHFTEIILGMPFMRHQLIAKYDLVLKTNNDKYIIYDWKTSLNKPSRTLLSQRYQTFLYPYIFVKTGNSIFNTEIPSPQNVSMNYWYPMSSDPEEIFPYSDVLYSENTDQLKEVISKIDGYVISKEIFPLTDDLTQCAKCMFRSLCERGVQTAKLDLFTEIDQEDLSGFQFDLENINELEF